jgi:hypothetical protein
MYGGQHVDPNVFYYLTVYNEPMIQPAEPAGVDVDGLLRGMYKYRAASGGQIPAQILASGVSVPWALKAQEILASDWNVAADVWSVTSWNELRRDGRDSDRYNFLHPAELPRIPYVTEKLRGERGPVIAVSDFMHAFATEEGYAELAPKFQKEVDHLLAAGADVIVPAGGLPMMMFGGRQDHRKIRIQTEGAPIINGITVMIKAAEMAVRMRQLDDVSVSRRSNYAHPPEQALKEFLEQG